VDQAARLVLVELVLDGDVAGRREAADGDLVVLAEVPPRGAAALRPVRVLVRVFLLDALELGVLVPRRLLIPVLREPELPS
jgi:hypothetical protein